MRHLITVVDPKRVPEADPESVRTMGAAPDTTATPTEKEEPAESVTEIAAVETPTEEKSTGDKTSDEIKTDA
ncbi:hypothetical protein KKH27_07295, partial [bacterium]|nr:hypothetical protein [bacterium]